MNTLIRNLIALTAAALPVAASAQYQAPADSVSAAMATVIGGYVDSSLQEQYPADGLAREMFLDGLRKAFEIKSVDAVYYDGLVQGMRMRDNLEQMRAAGYPVDDAMFLDALVKLMDGKSTGFDSASADAYLTAIQNRSAEADRQLQADFLSRQAAREGVVTMPSGLLFEVVTEGDGDSPVAGDTVEVFYTGKLADGTVFDGTKDQPARLPVDRLIAGFSEGLKLMKPGGTYRLYIPSQLGYGPKGAGQDIPGGAALEFEVTLVGVSR